jgi:GNAT superfamily N-acetyltransferase
MKLTISGPLTGQSSNCEPILRSLPDWFGIEEAIQYYAARINDLPTFLATTLSGVVGFMTLLQHSPYAAEIYVMGIREEAHRQGIGRTLIEHGMSYLRGLGVEYLQVKTLSPSRPDEHYDRTRNFYFSCGFRPLEEMPELWGKENPCLIMVQKIS